MNAPANAPAIGSRDVSTVAGLIRALQACDPGATVVVRTIEMGEVNCSIQCTGVKVVTAGGERLVILEGDFDRLGSADHAEFGAGHHTCV